MKMFDKFDNTSEGYIPNNRPVEIDQAPLVNTTWSFSHSFPLFNIKEELLGFEWNYGDAVSIPFESSGVILDSEDDVCNLYDYLQAGDITVDILDWKYQSKLSLDMHEVVDAGDKVVLILEIDKDTSAELIPGTYHVQISVNDYIIYSAHDAVLVVK